MNDSAQTLDAAVDAADRHLKKGEPLLAYNVVQEALQRWPEHARLRQLQALALARSGDIQRANSVLESLAQAGFDDAETLGLLARTHKDLGLAALDDGPRTHHLASGFALYERAYERARREGADDAAWYTGINAATMAVFRRDLVTARRIAAEVRDLCAGIEGKEEAPAAHYWREATLGEAALILGDAEAALAHYTRAMALADRRFGDVSSTRRQARLLASYLHLADFDVDSMLRIPPVVIYSGHMIDRPDRRDARFPAALADEVRESLREKLAALAPIAAYGSAACGTDLLCLEIARESGCETHIVLPFPPADFRRISVDFAGGDWGERFDRALGEAESVTITSDHYARGSTATFDYANLVLTGMGRLRAQTLDAALRAIVVRHPEDPSTRGGTTSNLAMWRKVGIEVDEVQLATLGKSVTADSPGIMRAAAGGVRHEMRALLFADAVGYSKLSEDQIPGYIEGFLGAVADLSRRTAHRFEHVETSGDGLYMVFANATDAGHYALELSALVDRFDRAAWGLPPTFGMRVALHCGPVHCGIDPITGFPIYTGPHTSRTARIEPITPPGQVYASSAFAAVAAASGDAFHMSYVGRMPLAKGYGLLGLYHVRATIG